MIVNTNFEGEALIAYGEGYGKGMGDGYESGYLAALKNVLTELTRNSYTVDCDKDMVIWTEYDIRSALEICAMKLGQGTQKKWEEFYGEFIKSED